MCPYEYKLVAHMKSCPIRTEEYSSQEPAVRDRLRHMPQSDVDVDHQIDAEELCIDGEDPIRMELSLTYLNMAIRRS